MKITFINDGIYTYAQDLANAVGGAERQQWLLARALVTKGWAVTVGVRNLLTAGERRTINGVDFVGIGQGQFFLAFYRFLVSERPHWVYWRGADHLLGPCTAIARSLGIRTVFSLAFDTEVQPRSALFRRQRWWRLYAWGLSLSDVIFVQHGQQLAGLKPSLQTKALILRSMVHQVANTKPHSEREPSIVWAAVLRQPKRPDVLIHIARQAPTVRFIVCGGTTAYQCPPGYGERIVAELQATPNIEYLGQVAPNKSLQVIANASLLLSTSDEEGFPNTFLEAWTSGTPVVSVKIDPDHIIQRRQLGTVSYSVEQTLFDIKALLNAPQRRDDIAARARSYIEASHSERVIVNAFEQALEQAGDYMKQSSVRGLRDTIA
ncbi:MAG: glycosyltransferase family 4 protein [Candidatus Binatia bacterium]